MEDGADGATKAADGRAGAGGRVFGDFGFDVGFDWRAVKTEKIEKWKVSMKMRSRSR